MFRLLIASLIITASAFAEIKPDPNLARIIQTLEVFNRPESCAVSLDGKHLFVTNTAATTDGMPLGKGVISKLEIQTDGTLKMAKFNFVEGLNAPMGVAAAPKQTKAFPAGSLYVAVGNIDACDDKGTRITDVKLCNPGIAVFDPANGQQLGFIPMGPGTAVAQNLFHPVLQPCGVCFDPDGNLFFADGGQLGPDLKPAERGRPGVKRIRLEHIDIYAANKQIGNVSFVPVRFIPNHVHYSKADDALYWSCIGNGPAGGAVYRTPRKDYPAENMAGNVVGDLGPLGGLCITPNGTLIMSRQDGDIAYITRKSLDVVPFTDEGLVFGTPAGIKLHVLPNGNKILYIPEKEPVAEKQWNQRLRVVLLAERM